MISGKQGSGKSSLAHALSLAIHKRTGMYVGVHKFAGHLYTIHDYILNYMERITGKPRAEKDGDLLQYLGTEYGRVKHGQNVWVQGLRDSIRQDARNFIIIDDCRFENEFDGIEALKIRLECPVEDRKIRCSAWRDNDTHPSETGLDDYARKGMFDLTYSTNVLSTDYIVGDILEILDIV
jgi:energy-coupling factor transporter ATP-binding protein EcfA2